MLVKWKVKKLKNKTFTGTIWKLILNNSFLNVKHAWNWRVKKDHFKAMKKRPKKRFLYQISKPLLGYEFAWNSSWIDVIKEK